MSIFDRLVRAKDVPQPAQPESGSNQPESGVFTAEHFPAPDAAEKQLAESRKPHFVQTANIVVDQSRSWEQDLQTLQKFWKFVYERQQGLIHQFQAQVNK